MNPVATPASRSGGPRERASRPGTRRAAAWAEPQFPLALRGYDREAVDDYVAHSRRLLAELKARRSPQGAVKEALDRVGEETSGILQRAHETAEEITGAARLEAEQRVAAADQAASALRDEAEEHARKLAADTEALWQERCMLIDDMRTLAEGLLAGADAAAERLRKPDVAASEPVDVAPDPPPADASAAEREVEERPPAEVADEVADAEEPARDDGPASAGAPIDWEPDSGASEPIIRRTDNPPTEQFDPLAHEDEADVENLRAMEFRRRWST